MIYLKTYERYRKEKYDNKKLIIIDIQPTYRIHMNMDMTDFTHWLNEHDYFNILYLYNGPDFGYEDEYEIRDWLRDYDLEDSSNMSFFEKNYAFFRDFMDNDVDDDEIVKVGKYLIEKDIRDIREIDEEDRKYLLENVDIDEKFLNGDWSFYIPEAKDELMSFLNKGDKPLCIGGGEYQCFKEIILLLRMLDFEWDEESQFIY